MTTTALAQEIATTLYEAGRSRADSVVLPGQRPISFADWVQRELDADPVRAGLLTELRNMIAVYWGEGDGEEPLPDCIIRARAAIAKVEAQS